MVRGTQKIFKNLSVGIKILLRLRFISIEWLALLSIERETALSLYLDEFVEEFARNHFNRKNCIDFKLINKNLIFKKICIPLDLKSW
jgi:hypothetical protein